MPILYLIHPLSGLLMLFLAAGYGVWLARKYRLGWGAFALGAITFVLSQVVHLPLNSLIGDQLQSNPDILPPPQLQIYFYAVLFGFTAGLSEEGLRFFVLRGWAKRIRTWDGGVVFGAGHGGMESAILGLLVLVNFFYLAAYKDRDLSTLVPLDQLEIARIQIETYWSIDWYVPLVGVLERALTIPIHISLALMVQRVFVSRKPLWLFAAILYHTAVNAAALTLMNFGGIWAAEGILVVFMLFSIGLIRYFQKAEGNIQEERVEREIDSPINIRSVEIFDDFDEKVQDSRYTEK